MNTTKHTPGPWHIGMRPGPLVYGPLGEQIADCRSISSDNEINRRNAHLIAAAPALYEALNKMTAIVLNTFEGGYDIHGEERPWITKSRQALAQAEGK